MIREAATINERENLEADLCIIGGGAAGLTIANEFRRRRFRTILLESGGPSFEPLTQKLYEGPVSSDVVGRESGYLMYSRLRQLGGSTNHWSGWCRPLDELDFEKRPWLPGSGWPLRRSDLDPYYRRAASTLAIGETPADDPPAGGEPPLLFGEESDRLKSVYFNVSPLTIHNLSHHHRFRNRYGDSLEAARGIDLIQHANLRELEVDESGSAIARAKAVTIEGRTFYVRARYFVLACGGIENARILLASNSRVATGIGNDRDMVGRYFMEHLYVDAPARFLYSGAAPSLRAYRKQPGSGESERVAVLTLNHRALRSSELLNFCVEVRISEAVDQIRTPVTAGVSSLTTATANRLPETPSRRDMLLPILVRTEQSPSADNRVTLSRELDANGMPRGELRWMLSSADRRCVRESVRIFAEELGRAGLGRAQVISEEVEPARNVHGNAHHMGTTRMHDDPSQGVVDRHCKVHGIRNLYVAGSSVFTTSGYASPTLTIVALAHRLADHLFEILKGETVR